MGDRATPQRYGSPTGDRGRSDPRQLRPMDRRAGRGTAAVGGPRPAMGGRRPGEGRAERSSRPAPRRRTGPRLRGTEGGPWPWPPHSSRRSGLTGQSNSRSASPPDRCGRTTTWSSPSPTAGRSSASRTGARGRPACEKRTCARSGYTTGGTRRPRCCSRKTCTPGSSWRSWATRRCERRRTPRRGRPHGKSAVGLTWHRIRSSGHHDGTRNDQGRSPGGERPGHEGGAEGTRTPDPHTARPS